MSNTLALQGIIIAIEEMGGKFIKQENGFLYLDITKNSEIDDNDRLARIQEVMNEMYGLKLKVRRV